MSLLPDIVMISNVDWNAAWQRHHTFASLLSKQTRVFYIENSGFRRLRLHHAKSMALRIKRWGRKQKRTTSNPRPDSVTVVTPLVLPPYGIWFEAINRKVFLPLLVKKMQNQGLNNNPIIWTYLPTTTTLTMNELLQPIGLVYDCVSNFYGHPDAPSNLSSVEKSLLQTANIVLTDSNYLFKTYYTQHQNVQQLHHGVEFELFTQANAQNIRKGTLCYFGSIHEHLNWDVIYELARAGIEVTLIGPLIRPLPKYLPFNVLVRPQLPPYELVQTLKPYQAILLPYRTESSFMQGVIPAKIYESLATGKPVISSPLPSYTDELKENLYLCAEAQDFIKIVRTLDTLESPEKQQHRLELAKRFSREIVANNLNNIITRLLA